MPGKEWTGISYPKTLSAVHGMGTCAAALLLYCIVLQAVRDSKASAAFAYLYSLQACMGSHKQSHTADSAPCNRALPSHICLSAFACVKCVRVCVCVVRVCVCVYVSVSPDCDSLFMKETLVSVGIGVFSFCSPSLGPTCIPHSTQKIAPRLCSCVN